MQFRSVRVLEMQMRFMIEADNLCCIFDRIFFLNKFVIDILTKYLSSFFFCTDIVNIKDLFLHL